MRAKDSERMVWGSGEGSLVCVPGADTSGPNGTVDTEEGIFKPDSALSSASEIAGAEATRVATSVIGTSPTVSTSISVDIVGGGVQTARAPTFKRLTEGVIGDALATDESLLFEQAPGRSSFMTPDCISLGTSEDGAEAVMGGRNASTCSYWYPTIADNFLSFDPHDQNEGSQTCSVAGGTAKSPTPSTCGARSTPHNLP
ncbi:hypothetical protein AMTR_s00127p00096540 [Amborella trichopoda]|uniref:Uncharacterized protein n=1 Tax=Amborella trichopoda TaxID=13333 RepID=W1NNR5_AMBTC|nr:hypothetical protein AMTR_s00127p00096540 [Amborella trichopoda]